ncbi:GNAT family N-acetyltransferase [Candidatus Nucleicultrix amoebiphila]|uniref:GNAT family N-acetyltransferase n=1 Tax=Candidatus Nucleicultrix amoebiphila TaxID=1509244 RepID=UPI0018DD0787|nr:GNAT family N-acetyltransferase [Candidatus Nucleicultrix amoebiphila]
MGFGYWRVEEKSTQRFVGDVGFADFKRDMIPALESPEMGCALAYPFHGQSYGYEAVKAVTAWGDAYLKEKKTCCIIRPENLPSLRLAEKCGYQQQHLTSYKGHETLVLSRISLFGV